MITRTHAHLALLLLALLGGCGGSTASTPTTADESTTRPVRVESDEPPSTAPSRIASPEEQAASDPGLSSDELADPPPVEPP